MFSIPSDHHETGKRIRLNRNICLFPLPCRISSAITSATHDNFRAFADKVRIQINDTHPALAIAELIRILTQNHDLPWKMAVDMTQACSGYTNHTILKRSARTVGSAPFLSTCFRANIRLSNGSISNFAIRSANKYPQ